MNNPKTEHSVEAFKKGINCSMAVFSTFAADYGVKEEVALKIAAPFGGGMGRMGETCGAVTGAFMVFRLAYPHMSGESMEEFKKRLYGIVREFACKFSERHRSIQCREILGCDSSAHKVITV